MSLVVDAAAAAAYAGALVAGLAHSGAYLPTYAQGWQDANWAGWSSFLPGFALCFAALWVLEAAAYRCLNVVSALVKSDIFETPRNRAILARHVMDTAALSFVAYIGCDMYMRQASYPETALERLYVRLPEYEFLCVAMLAFQTKNLVDSLTWKDPPEYVAHHIVCVLVAIGTLDGHFLHLYGIFFFGVSEVSTAVLSALASFDPEHGVAALARAMPVTKVLLGALFAVLFVSIRLVAWPYLAYHLANDAVEVLRAGEAHSQPVVVTFLAFLAGLTLLQFFWLTEILKRAADELKPKAKAN
ncbi:hypothetical protein M885DRAFT_525580 [Pelagophyceae sp. CCMP2097]|nr:hypothetical protein M885DRAFT_525580 [Pelagophyceae sp. CCMP2097]|mmetsp:Transcript_28716/g.96736  ORF Transcript_28716/g.96736 Transcript_28716/m.96736 type:complete len:301 (+) Transcript_28716:76-978(+)|eukprot:CAMPEP_0184105422 /NCGR_PEP_ID=MMETSP0974-20121125/14865_1 /TAXON_ID=483370 /ORGANISM="non described non described, Strain CCMP2097" /LENGTH=300 /DNA_ID=CAMNT_0026408431 /DNA_START=49 /DNA_END=951 /DNA_ORIENTATION=+